MYNIYLFSPLVFRLKCLCCLPFADICICVTFSRNFDGKREGPSFCSRLVTDEPESLCETTSIRIVIWCSISFGTSHYIGIPEDSG